MEQNTEASQAVDDLDALASRLSRIHDACLDNRPKQAVGEMICAAQNMPEWNRVRAALKAQPATTEAAQGEDSARLDWQRITAPGQVKVGDKLRFTIGDEKFSERVKQIINPGYPDEELIYNKLRNFYVITSNAITNFGSSKNVEFLARASAETGGVKP